MTSGEKKMIQFDHYLPQDREHVIKENYCIYALLHLIQVNVEKGNLDRANEALVDVVKSINELSHLQQHKRDKDKLVELARLMTQEKIPLQSALIIQQKQR